jgi:hypothetical protein
MERGILTGLHSNSPKSFMESMKDCIDGWAFLGDYDDPKILRELMDLGRDRILIIGNHEYDFATIESSSEEVSQKNNELFYDWKNSEDEKNFVLDCVDDLETNDHGVRVFRPGNYGSILYTHSNIGRNLEASLKDRFRYDIHVVEDNFIEMAKRNIHIMFRGHDHKGMIGDSRVITSNREGLDLLVEPFNLEVPFSFSGDRRYIVSVGAFRFGDYAIFDDVDNSVIFLNRFK